MGSYFPDVHVPDEVMFGILKNLPTGAIWLFCRGVSRVWKRHVDAYIERYYCSYVESLKAERKRKKNQFGSRTCDWRWDKGRRADADTLYLELGWGDCINTDRRKSYLEFECCNVEIPELNERDLSIEDWNETVTFRAAVPKVVNSSYQWYDLPRMYHYLFPGFKQVEIEEGAFSWERAPPLQQGTWVVSCGPYELAYSLRYSVSVQNEASLLLIHYITVPMRELLHFSSPRTVRKAQMPTDATRSRYASSLFNTISDNLTPPLHTTHLPSDLGNICPNCFMALAPQFSNNLCEYCFSETIETSQPASESDDESSGSESNALSDPESHNSIRSSSMANLSDTDYEVEHPSKPHTPPPPNSAYDWFLNEPAFLPPPLTRNSESDYEADYDSGSDFE